MEENHYDFISIGSGPAGLSAAQYASRANLRTLVLDEGLQGGQVANIATLENYPGVFPAVQGFDFMDAMRRQAEAFGAGVVQARVSSVEKGADGFTVRTAKGDFLARTVLLATGAAHRTLGVPGEAELSGHGVSYCATCDGPFFRGKHVVVVGGGDSACDEAVYLAGICSGVTVVHRRGEFRAQKAVAARVLSDPRITVRFDSVVTEIKGSGSVSSVVIAGTDGSSASELAASGVFIFAGMIPRTELFGGVRKDDAGYVLTDEGMGTSVPGLYAAGDVRAKGFRQVVTACADGAVAARSAYLYIQAQSGKEYR